MKNGKRNGQPPPPPVPEVRPILTDENLAKEIMQLGRRAMRDPIEAVGLINAGLMIKRMGVPGHQGAIHLQLGAGYVSRLVNEVVDRHAPPPANGSTDEEIKAHVEALPAWAREMLAALGIIKVEKAPEPEPEKEETLEERAMRNAGLVIAKP